MQTPIVDNLKTYFTMYFDNLIRLYTYNYIHYNIDKCKPQYLYYKKGCERMNTDMTEKEMKTVKMSTLYELRLLFAQGEKEEYSKQEIVELLDKIATAKEQE